MHVFIAISPYIRFYILICFKLNSSNYILIFISYPFVQVYVNWMSKIYLNFFKVPGYVLGVIIKFLFLLILSNCT
jgi:hypothetical protein